MTVFTFDSPLGGTGDIRGFGSLSQAGRNLTTEIEQLLMAHGTSRIDYVQIGNVDDDVVRLDESFTAHAWRRLETDCRSIEDLLGHSCSMSEPGAAAIVSDALAAAPPVWTSRVERPGPFDVSVSAGFSTDVTTGEVTLTVRFESESASPIEAWLWDFGDGAASDEPAPVHTYQDPGSYDVSFSVSNRFGEHVLARSRLISVTAP